MVYSNDLYWSIDAIRVCMLHGSELVDRCYRCRKPQPYISTIVEPGFCHHCFAFLGDGYAKLVDPEYAQSQVVQYHMLYISSFDELRPDVGQLRRNLHALREAHPMGDSENFGAVSWCIRRRSKKVANWQAETEAGEPRKAIRRVGT